MGRPSLYTPELAAEICRRLSQGMSLRTVCKADDMPDASSVFLWIQRHEEFSHQYARAKEESADAMSEDMLAIADDDGEDVQRSRLRIDTRKWLASKLKPKKYGEKVDHTHAAPGGGPIVTRIEIVALHGNSTDPASPEADPSI